tara:strand:- start:225330 stop:226850 length:1521 start_codon:yes stop_codon:yes gene_type:complete
LKDRESVRSMVMVLESTDRSQRFPLDRESIFVGSSEWKSDICLTGQDIADVHCELTLVDQGVRVVALADGGVTVNGETVREATLSAGDELGIAVLRFRLSDRTDDVDAAMPESERANLQVRQKPVTPHLSRWMVCMSGMNLGPLDWDELQTMVGRGEVRLDDEVQKECETTWQLLRDILPRSGGDGLLCDDVSTESVDFVPRQRRVRSKSDSSEAASRSTPQERADREDDSPNEREAAADLAGPLAPQFFIMRGGEEVGPLPRQAIQELADQGSLFADAAVRLEDAETWSTAAAVGFHCSAVAPANSQTDSIAEPTNQKSAAGIMWLLFAPYYFVSGAARMIESVDPRRAAKWGVVILVVGVVAFGWLKSWSQTAMRGVVTLDGQPVANFLVQLTGAQTGDSAMGVTDEDGDFRVVTLDGELKPGLYLVTVRPLSEVNGNRPTTDDPETLTSKPTMPDRYRHLNTTDAAIEILADQSNYSVDLTTQQQSVSGGFRGSRSLTPHSLP